MHALFIEELPYNPNQVTPGWIGFAAIALVAVVVMFLMWDFNRRVRRINDRADVRERLEAEVEAQRIQQVDAAVESQDGSTDAVTDAAQDTAGEAPQRSS